MSFRGWIAFGLAVVCAVAAGRAESALAHAVLLRTIPSSSQTLPRAPGEVRLLFSEPIDAVFSSVHVSTAAGQVVDRGDAHVDPEDDHQLVVTLQPGLPNGIYSVAWRSLSTIDVHPDQGVYPLFVGVPAVAASPGTSAVALTGTTPATTLGRWWFYVAASLFGGVLATWKLVLGPVLADGRPEARAAPHRRAHRTIVVGGVLLVVGTLFTAVAQAAAAADVPLGAAVGQPLADLLLRGRFAVIWWPRIGLEVASLLLIAFADLDGLAAECALATLPGVLLTSALTSHGAALPAMSGVGIAIDWLHIVGATAWVGGLIGLLICLTDMKSRHDGLDVRSSLTLLLGSNSTGVAPRLMARFSRFALAASGIVVLSGIVQAVVEVGAWSALINTFYGAMVLLKIGLLAAMLGLAGVNTWRAGHAWAVNVRAELLLGVVVLAVAAVLTGTPPVRGVP